MIQVDIVGTIHETVFKNNQFIGVLDKSYVDSSHDEVEGLLHVGEDLGSEVLRTAKLISKLHRLYNEQSDMLEKFKNMMNVIELLLFKYYGGKMDEAVYKKYGSVHDKYTKDDIAKVASSDTLYKNVKSSIEKLNRILVFLEDQTKYVTYSRVKAIQASMDWQKFILSGQ